MARDAAVALINQALTGLMMPRMREDLRAALVCLEVIK
jgi:hypothetical protein